MNAHIAAAHGIDLKGTIRVPLAALRLASIAVRPFNEVLSRHLHFSTLLDTHPQTADSATTWHTTGITPTTIEDWLHATTRA